MVLLDHKARISFAWDSEADTRLPLIPSSPRTAQGPVLTRSDFFFVKDALYHRSESEWDPFSTRDYFKCVPVCASNPR